MGRIRFFLFIHGFWVWLETCAVSRSYQSVLNPVTDYFTWDQPGPCQTRSRCHQFPVFRFSSLVVKWY